LDDPDAFMAALRDLRVRDQDVTVIHILDRNELEFPFDRMTEFRHPETNRRLVGDPAVLRANYLARLRAHIDRIERGCQKSQAEYLRLDNGAALARLLSLHLIRRLLRGGGR